MQSGKPKNRRAVSLARALSKLGYTSRSQAEKVIRAGEVMVNRNVVTNPSFRCDLHNDRITVGDENIEKKKFIYIVINKPEGVVTTRSDELGRTTVYDILGDIGKWIFPVGRLDKETSGLLLLTNDNQLGERLTNPQSKIPKTYLVQIDKPMTRDAIEQFQHGMKLNGERLLPAKIKIIKETLLQVTIIEGKNRQIRRMVEEIGYKIVSLSRIKIGSYELRGIGKGKWKQLNEMEIRKIVN